MAEVPIIEMQENPMQSETKQKKIERNESVEGRTSTEPWNEERRIKLMYVVSYSLYMYDLIYLHVLRYTCIAVKTLTDVGSIGFCLRVFFWINAMQFCNTKQDGVRRVWPLGAFSTVSEQVTCRQLQLYASNLPEDYCHNEVP